MSFRDLFGDDRPPVVLVTGANKGLGLETGRQPPLRVAPSFWAAAT